mmetsp:Transcript_27040/g.38325  ORF Transcript_27040/g.38325 Transcript_27040/m.38325 type:complete len:85 (-) Transcript_27040:293-547(-)
MQKKSKVVAVIAVVPNNPATQKLPDQTLHNLIKSKIEESGIREEDPDYTIPRIPSSITSKLGTSPNPPKESPLPSNQWNRFWLS